jgi:hypothetical protein
MSKRFLAVLTLCATGMLTGAASAAESTEGAAPAAPVTDAPATDAPATAAEPAPAPAAAPASGATTGTVIFFRPSRFAGAAMGFKVRENNVELGKLRNAKYFVLKVAPGTHEYVVHSETKDTLVLEVEAGETYYVEGKLGMGIVAGRPNLSPSDQAAFEAAKPKLKEVAPLADDAD